MAEDLVKRLRENHEALRGPDYYEAYTTIEQQAASLAGKDKEIERRDAFIRELSDALLTVRPLGGSELFVKRFGQHYADPAYCKAAIVERHEQYHEAMKGQVRERKRAEQAEQERDELREWKQNQQVHWPSEIERRNRDLERAERALAEAVEVMRPVADVTLPWGDIGAGMILARDVQAARAFVAQHGSDSREGK